MSERMRGWMLRSVSSAQCSPALIVLALIAAFATVCYVYRQIIIDTLEIVGLVILCGGFLIILALLARTAYAWRQDSLDTAIERHEVAPAPVQHVQSGQTVEILDSADAWPILDGPELSEADLPGSDTAWAREIDGLLKK